MTLIYKKSQFFYNQYLVKSLHEQIEILKKEVYFLLGELREKVIF